MSTIRTHLISKRDGHDERDFHFVPAVASPPPSADISRLCASVYNQLQIKSCSANAISAALAILGNQSGKQIVPPSRLFLYYNSRLREGDVSTDGGASIRNAIKAAAKPGLCAESSWPYDITKTVELPPKSAYDTITIRATAYYKIEQDLAPLRSCIAEGYPFIFGIQIFESTLEAAQHEGRLQMPLERDTLLGGHAVLGVAYDDAAQCVTALNSLGTAWGTKGFFTIPYAYLTNPELSYDFWTIRSIETH